MQLKQTEPSYAEFAERYAKLFDQFEDAWSAGTPLEIESLLSSIDQGDRIPVLAELVQIDLERRLTSGDPARVESYFGRFPELAAYANSAVELIAAEFALRRRTEPMLSSAEYAARFPLWQEAIAAAFSRSAGNALSRRAGIPAPVDDVPVGWAVPTGDSTSPAGTPAGHTPQDAPGGDSPPGNSDSTDISPPRASDTHKPPPLTVSPMALPRPFGDYELLSEIARGGMGVVYKARQKGLNRLVALKMILAGQLADEEAVRRFRAEAEAAAHLRHPGIVAVYEVGEHEGQHFFSMEYVEGPSLAALARENPFSPKAAARVVQSLAEAMHYAHEQGILHRDLKPANVLMDYRDDGLARSVGNALRGVPSAPEGSADSTNNSDDSHDSERHGGRSLQSAPEHYPIASFAPRITDFGLAKRLHADGPGLTQTHDVMGTPSYMPPEQAAGRIRDIGPHSDVYSLGAILYELLTGRPPFRADTRLETLREVLERDPVSPRLLNSKTPRDLETICLKCLENNPGRRYPSATTLAEELGRFLRNEPISARPISTVSRAVRWCRRKPLATAVAGLVAVVFAMIVIGGPMWTMRETDLKRTANKKQQEAIRADNEAAAAGRLAITKTEEASTAGRIAKAAQERSKAANKIAQDERASSALLATSGDPPYRRRIANRSATISHSQHTFGSGGCQAIIRPRPKLPYHGRKRVARVFKHRRRLAATQCRASPCNQSRRALAGHGSSGPGSPTLESNI